MNSGDLGPQLFVSWDLDFRYSLVGQRPSLIHLTTGPKSRASAWSSFISSSEISGRTLTWQTPKGSVSSSALSNSTTHSARGSYQSIVCRKVSTFRQRYYATDLVNARCQDRIPLASLFIMLGFLQEFWTFGATSNYSYPFEGWLWFRRDNDESVGLHKQEFLTGCAIFLLHFAHYSPEERDWTFGTVQFLTEHGSDCDFGSINVKNAWYVRNGKSQRSGFHQHIFQSLERNLGFRCPFEASLFTCQACHWFSYRRRAFDKFPVIHARPMKAWTSFTLCGIRKSHIASTLSFMGLIPAALTRCPRYWIYILNRTHLDSLTLRPMDWSLSKSLRIRSRSSCGVRP